MSELSYRLKTEGEAARVLVANIRDVYGDDAEMIENTVEGETDLKEVISDAVNRISELNGHCEALDAMMKAMKERRDRFEDQAARIKAAIHVAMGQADIRKLELPQATLSVRAVAPSVEVKNEAEIPPRFWKPQDPKLDRKALLAALKAKEDVPGASLSNGGETLSILGA